MNFTKNKKTAVSVFYYIYIYYIYYICWGIWTDFAHNNY